MDSRSLTEKPGSDGVCTRTARSSDGPTRPQAADVVAPSPGLARRVLRLLRHGPPRTGPGGRPSHRADATHRDARHNARSRALLAGAVLVLAAGPSGADPLDIADEPLFLSQPVKPPLVLMLDNSRSMAERANAALDAASPHDGIFDPDQNYEYDATIPVNAAAYSVAVDETQTGAFVASGCTPDAATTTCWEGGVLNYITGRKVDMVRDVLIGGTLEDQDPYAYGSGLDYKIVGYRSLFGDLSSHVGDVAARSPAAGQQHVRVINLNSGEQQAEYSPYPVMRYAPKGDAGKQLVHDAAGNPIGEWGSRRLHALPSVDAGACEEATEIDHCSGELEPATMVRDENGRLAEEAWEEVAFTGTYTDPILVVTHSDAIDGALRVRNLTATGFEIAGEEFAYLDGEAPASMRANWFVVEAGAHVLPGGLELEAGEIVTDRLWFAGHQPKRKERVNFAASFPGAPVVLSSVVTYAGASAVTSRAWGVGDNGFDLAMQEEEAEADTGHPPETVHWIAIEPGIVRAGDSADPDKSFILQAGTVSGAFDEWTTISPFIEPLPQGQATDNLFTHLQTLNSDDTAWSEHRETGIESFALHIDEEVSLDAEESHGSETVGWMNVVKPLPLRNVALAVPDKPTGLLDRVGDKTRIGLSFFRYDPDSRVDTGAYDGGTLQFQLPRNPFVRWPALPPLLGASHVPGYDAVDGYVGGSQAAFVDAIQRYPLKDDTSPLAENLWEVIQYWEQDAPYYDTVDPIPGARPDFETAAATGIPERDPLHDPNYATELECTQPTTLLFTDGKATHDESIPAAVADYDGDGASDDTTADVEAFYGNLDDVAYWGFCDESEAANCDPGDRDGGTRDLRPDIDDIQSHRTLAIVFGADEPGPVLQDAVDQSGGTAYAAEDAGELAKAFKQAVEGIVGRSSFSAVAADQGAVTTDTTIFQALFDSTDWTGDIEAMSLDVDSLQVDPTVHWSAADELPAPEFRRILTFDGATGQEFTWGSLDASQRAALNDDPDLLAYLRGSAAREGTDSGDFRERSTPLGDIVHSKPLFVPGDGSEPDMLYVGANDGMLHGFNVETGEEELAYVPRGVFDKLADLADPGYSHQFYVDGSPTFARRYYQETGDRVIVGGLGAGGSSIYALEVNDPDNPLPGQTVLWEFDDHAADPDGDGTNEGDPDLGRTFARPTVVPIATGGWAAVFGNGYNSTEADGSASTTGHAVLFVVDLATGHVIAKLDTGSGSTSDPNGLSSPAVIDLDVDGVADYAYAGDLHGNLWKFDLRAGNPNSWSAEKLFEARSAGGDVQPITVKPQVGFHPQSRPGAMVYFGTGQYIEQADNSSVDQVTQTFYGIWDYVDTDGGGGGAGGGNGGGGNGGGGNGGGGGGGGGGSGPLFDRADLLEQTILEESSVTRTDASGNLLQSNLRKTSDHEISQWYDGTDGQGGWYMDLVDPDDPGDNRGERVTAVPRLRGDRIVFTTLLPTPSPCDYGGTSWLMELHAGDGGRLDEPTFDLDDDADFDAADLDDAGDVPSGLQPQGGDGGMFTSPTFLDTPKVELKVISTTKGNVLDVNDNPMAGDRGRQAWEELR